MRYTLLAGLSWYKGRQYDPLAYGVLMGEEPLTNLDQILGCRCLEKWYDSIANALDGLIKRKEGGGGDVSSKVACTSPANQTPDFYERQDTCESLRLEQSAGAVSSKANSSLDKQEGYCADGKDDTNSFEIGRVQKIVSSSTDDPLRSLVTHSAQPGRVLAMLTCEQGCLHTISEISGLKSSGKMG